MATPSGAIAVTGAHWSGHFTCQKRPHHVSPTRGGWPIDLLARKPYRPDMNRRRFLLTSLAGAFAAPLAAEAQPMGKRPRVGILVTANPRLYDPFVEELRSLGYLDGQNIVLEFRSAEGRIERFPALAADLVRAGVNVTLAVSEASVRAAQQASTRTPIVIVAIDYDPLALKMVTSLARPGANVTGLFLQQLEVTAKRIELLKGMLPKLTRLAVLWDPSGADQFKAAEAASLSLRLRVQSLKIRPNPDDLSGAFAAAVRERADAIAVVQTRCSAVSARRSYNWRPAIGFQRRSRSGNSPRPAAL